MVKNIINKKIEIKNNLKMLLKIVYDYPRWRLASAPLKVRHLDF